MKAFIIIGIWNDLCIPQLEKCMGPTIESRTRRLLEGMGGLGSFYKTHSVTSHCAVRERLAACSL